MGYFQQRSGWWWLMVHANGTQAVFRQRCGRHDRPARLQRQDLLAPHKDWGNETCQKPSMGVSVNGGTTKWVVYKVESYWNGWFRGTPILGNPHMNLYQDYQRYHRHCLVHSNPNPSGFPKWERVKTPHPWKAHIKTAGVSANASPNKMVVW